MPPGFWRRDGVLPRLLSPLAAITAAVTARRVARPGWRAPVPVICCGNVTVGGAGKTTLALDLGPGSPRAGAPCTSCCAATAAPSAGRIDVAADDTAAQVGDEALLLAAVAPTWTGADRAASARPPSPPARRCWCWMTACRTPACTRTCRCWWSTARPASATAACCRRGRCASRWRPGRRAARRRC